MVLNMACEKADEIKSVCPVSTRLYPNAALHYLTQLVIQFHDHASLARCIV